MNFIQCSLVSAMEPEGDEDVIDWDTALEEIVCCRLLHVVTSVAPMLGPAPTHHLPCLRSYIFCLFSPPTG